MDRDTASAIELIPGKLYYVCVRTVPRSTGQAVFFSMDHELTYMRFFNDFGPLNLGQTYRFCVTLHHKIKEAGGKPLYYYTGHEPQRRANIACLISIYLVLTLDYEPEDAFAPFMKAHATFVPFRDASMNPSTFNLTIIDCLRGIAKAKRNGWINMSTFNLQEFEYYEKMENGDMSWILPGKFLAFSGPQAMSSKAAFRTHPPEFYIPSFKKLGINTVVRLNNKCYDRKKFTDSGISHYDLYFPDGSTPSDSILARFLEIAEKDMGGIAVHCKAGLGRTGTLIACYIMKHYRFTAHEAIGWLRLCRPGSIIGPQQHFLQGMQTRLWKMGEAMKSDAAPAEKDREKETKPALPSSALNDTAKRQSSLNQLLDDSSFLPPSIAKKSLSSSMNDAQLPKREITSSLSINSSTSLSTSTKSDSVQYDIRRSKENAGHGTDKIRMPVIPTSRGSSPASNFQTSVLGRPKPSFEATPTISAASRSVSVPYRGRPKQSAFTGPEIYGRS